VDEPEYIRPWEETFSQLKRAGDALFEKLKRNLVPLATEQSGGDQRMGMIEADADEVFVVTKQLDDVPSFRIAMNGLHLIAEDPLMSLSKAMFLVLPENELLLHAIKVERFAARSKSLIYVNTSMGFDSRGPVHATIVKNSCMGGCILFVGSHPNPLQYFSLW
jgi:hypothetical protein